MRALGERRVRHRLDEWLRGQWHPILPLAELHKSNGLVAVELAGSPIVLRVSDTRGVCGFVDRCPHRSVRLSAGTIEGDLLRCAGHGWSWNEDGRCVDVPGIVAVPGRASSRATLENVAVRVLYDWIWCRRYDDSPNDAEPLLGVSDGPDVPQLRQWLVCEAWPVSATRAIEMIGDPLRWLRDASAEVPGTVTADRQSVRWGNRVGAITVKLPVTVTVERFDPLAPPNDPRRAKEVVWVHATPTGLNESLIVSALLDGAESTSQWAGAIVSSVGALAHHLARRDLPVVPGSEISGPDDALSIAYRRGLLDGP